MDSQSTSSLRHQSTDTDFAELEKQFIRQKAYPDFDWVRFDGPSRLNLLPKPVSESCVAMVTTAGAHLTTDPPFNLKSRIGDHSYREIPQDVNWEDLVLSHVGYDTKRASVDKNCVFPLQRLRELEAEGIIGALARRHFSFMGYVAVTHPLVNGTAVEVAKKLKADDVDLVLLAPA